MNTPNQTPYVIVMTEISMTSIWSHSTLCHSHLSTRILFLMIGLLGMTALTVGQVRERETSYSQESLRRIRDGNPNSELRSDTDLHQFQRINGFSEGLAYVVVDGKWGFIDRTGTVVIQPQFDDAGCFRNGIAPVEKNKKWGYVDQKGNVVIDFVWDWASDFYENRALVMSGRLWGYIDTKGSVVIKPQFDLAHSFSDGLALVASRNNRQRAIDLRGYIDSNGQWIIKLDPTSYHPIGDFKDGLARVHILLGRDAGGNTIVKDGYIDKTGEVVLNPTLVAQSSGFYEGLAQFRIGPLSKGKYGFLNRDLVVVIEPQFDSAWHFSEGLVQVASNGKWGFADKQGTLVIKPQFDRTRYFSEGLAPVEINRKWGYINKSGSLVIEPQFDHAWNFSEGFALVALGESVGYIDKSGKYLWKPSK